MSSEEIKLTCLQIAREDFISFQQKAIDAILKLIEYSHKDKHVVDRLTKDLQILLNNGLPSVKEITERAERFYNYFKKNDMPVDPGLIY